MTATRKTLPRRGRPRRTPAQRAAQRADLIDRAIGAIRAAGPDVSMDELADRMGVSKPVVYDEFGGRVGLADAIAVASWQRLEHDLLQSLTTASHVDIGLIVRGSIDGLVRFIETEPQLYSFFVRAVRTDGRGLLDNGLVRVLRERLGFVISSFGARVDPDELAVLADGVYGFLFAAIESWQSTGRPSRDVIVDRLSEVIKLGLQGLEIMPPPQG